MAASVGITVGSAQRILADLIDAGFVERERIGRRNRYTVNRDALMLRHDAQNGYEIGGLLDLLHLHNPTLAPQTGPAPQTPSLG